MKTKRGMNYCGKGFFWVGSFQGESVFMFDFGGGVGLIDYVFIRFSLRCLEIRFLVLNL